jgi:hypothetical protein
VVSELYDRGPIQTYEVIWRSGHVERVLAHSVTYPGAGAEIFGRPRAHRVIEFHGEIGGRWLLTLRADEDDLLTVRLITEGEPIPGVPS